MKYFFLFSCLFIILFSCKKEAFKTSDANSGLITNIKQQLQDSISFEDFKQLDFNHSLITKYDKNNFSILQIPVHNKSIKTDFLLLKLEGSFSFTTGRFINITRDKDADTTKSSLSFNGKIKIQNLQRQMDISSVVKDGFIEAFSQPNNPIGQKNEVVILPPLLPDVIIVCTYPPGGGIGGGGWGGGFTSTPYYSLQSFLGGPSRGTGGDYSSSNPYGGSGSGGGGGGNSNPANGVIKHIDFEELLDQTTIDLKKYLACFNNIPDQGATCTISLLTDIPDDEDPNSFYNWQTGSPGHTFLQLGKKNGSQNVEQIIGFYPAHSWKTLVNLPVEGRFADNGEHEFNASITMDITPENFRSTLSQMVYLSTYIKYDIDDYNCTDFSLDIFNFKRNNPLVIPKYDVPGGNAANKTSTPQGVYKALKKMKDLTNTESKSISIPKEKAYSPASSGACN